MQSGLKDIAVISFCSAGNQHSSGAQYHIHLGFK